MAQPRRIIAKRLSDQVETALVSMIQSGDYVPGDRLPSERDLMAMFDVGRTSIREALFALQRKGVVKINRGDRPRVIEPEPAQLIADFSDVVAVVLSRPSGILHFNQARWFFEASVARQVAEMAQADDLAALDEALDANREAIGNVDDFAATDIAFHKTMAVITGNPIVLSVHDALVEWVMLRRIMRGDILASNRASYAGHVAITGAIHAGDGEAAYRLMADHIARADSEYELPH